MNQTPRVIRYNLIVVYAGWPTVLEFLEFLELFWNFFCTGNILEKSHFFRLVLELFLNSEFLRSDFLAYNISGFPLFGSPIFEKILPHLGSPCVLEKCENVLEMFWNCSGFFLKKLLATLTCEPGSTCYSLQLDSCICEPGSTCYSLQLDSCIYEPGSTCYSLQLDSCIYEPGSTCYSLQHDSCIYEPGSTCYSFQLDSCICEPSSTCFVAT